MEIDLYMCSNNPQKFNEEMQKLITKIKENYQKNGITMETEIIKNETYQYK